MSRIKLPATPAAPNPRKLDTSDVWEVTQNSVWFSSRAEDVSQGWWWFGEPMRGIWTRSGPCACMEKPEGREWGAKGGSCGCLPPCADVETLHVQIPKSTLHGRKVYQVYGVSTLRFVGVVWLILHVVQLPLSRFTLLILCYVGKFMMKHMQKSDWKSGIPLFSYGYRKCTFVDFSAGYMGLPNCVHCWVWSGY